MNDAFSTALLAIAGIYLASAGCESHRNINYQSSLANTEFRIVADPTVDIELARESIHTQEYEVQVAGRPAGKWVKCVDQRVPLCKQLSSKKTNGREEHVLVVLDRHNVTGADFESVEPGTCGDYPCVVFRFTQSGGQRFGSLTEENTDRQLAIILDEEVIAVPFIRSRVSERGQIEGHFTQLRVLSLVEKFYGGVGSASLAKFEAQAEGGDDLARHELCFAYSYGYEAPQDHGAAFKWCSLQAQQPESNSSKTLLAELYLNGTGAPQDFGQAFRWYSEAAAGGHSHAQFMMGVMYREGLGRDPDREKAEEWLRRAEKNGSEDASRALEKLQ